MIFNKIVLITMICLSLLASKLSAQISVSNRAENINHVIKVDPVAPILRSLNFGYEYVVDPNWSVQILGGPTYFKTELWDDLSGTVIGYKITPELRYNLMSKLSNDKIVNSNPIGFYTAFWFQHQSYKGTLEPKEIPPQNDEFWNYSSNAGGLILGNQFIVRINSNPICLLDVYGGFGYKVSETHARVFAEDVPSIIANKQFVPRVGIQIGIPF